MAKYTGHQAQRLIDPNDAEKDRVINMIEERKKKAEAKVEAQEQKKREREAIKAARDALNSTK